MYKEIASERTVIELSRDALAHNVKLLSDMLPEGCRLMPAVKANAYGHGAILLSKELNRLGIDAFCVASANEGDELRRNGITGDILVLGYTPESDFHLLSEADLIQTAVCADYAKQLSSFGENIKVHIGIDTGMHRLGESSENIDQIAELFSLPGIRVEGVYSHLSASDSKSGECRQFTLMQGKAFWDCVNILKNRGCDIKSAHILSSYGLLNYPELGGAYARVGIALYGYLETGEHAAESDLDLIPVLTFKSQIATVKDLKPGDKVGYGCRHVAEKAGKMAVIAAGFADGLPRALSCKRGSVLVRGKKAPIIGNICMDQTIIDVTGIDDVKPGDYAVIMGKSGDLEITAYDLAELTDSITNEVLSRLGDRALRRLK